MRHPHFNGKPVLLGDEIVLKRGDNKRHEVVDIRCIKSDETDYVHVRIRAVPHLIVEERDIIAHFPKEIEITQPFQIKTRREKLVEQATHIHNKEYKCTCDKRYITSCPNFTQAVLSLASEDL